MRKDLTQEMLCEKCGCTVSHLSRVETGKVRISLELLFQISVILNQRMDYLLMDTSTSAIDIKIDYMNRNKLRKCTPKTLELLDKIVDELLDYQ
jgi:transcriptional regulator with XRE-family HTH domain